MSALITRALIAAGMISFALPSAAGGFVVLPDYNPSAAATSVNPVNSVAKLTKTFNSNQTSDVSFLGTFTSGASIYDKVPTTFSLLASHTTDALPFTNGAGAPVNMGVFYDAVYRDNSDNSLVFASRLELGATSGVEINDIFRTGFSEVNVANNDTVAVGWSFGTVNDFRLKSAAKSDQGLYKVGTGTLPAHYNVDMIDLRTDTSAPESNPLSGWYFIKVKDNDVVNTLSTYTYEWVDHAVGIYRGNDEANGSITTLWLAGYAPTFKPAAPVPEPDSYAMMLIGLCMIGFAWRRRTWA